MKKFETYGLKTLFLLGDESKDSSLDERHLFSLLVEPRSLLVLQDDLYHKYLHGIKEVKCDAINEKVLSLNGPSAQNEGVEELTRSTRISLTIRHVPNTKKKLKLRL